MKPHAKPMNALMGTPATPATEMTQNALAPNLGSSASMYRPDGSMKGRGYLGPLKNARGETMTEYSMGIGLGGQEVDVPSLVPTLTPEEINYILNMQDGMPIPPNIAQKAADHARMRMSQGLSVFSDSPVHAKGRR